MPLREPKRRNPFFLWARDKLGLLSHALVGVHHTVVGYHHSSVDSRSWVSPHVGVQKGRSEKKQVIVAGQQPSDGSAEVLFLRLGQKLESELFLAFQVTKRMAYLFSAASLSPKNPRKIQVTAVQP